MSSPGRLRGVGDPSAFAQAIVDTIREPLLVLDKDLRIIVASRSFYSAFKVGPQDTQGRLLRELGDGEWDIPALRDLLERVAPEDGVIEGYEVERSFPEIGERIMLVNARKVFYEDHNTSSILVAFEDITDRRAAERERDELLAQKDMLLEEMQHRVANSLQIIASILLMKARAVQSSETRAHLQDAHNRVLAVAAVQRHLQAATGAEAIELEPYFARLCASLAGAMIPEGAEPITLNVKVASGAVSSSEAVSLGLIVTELVINALKHAFPVARAERAIVVSFVPDERGWKLAVSDNGVGKSHLVAATPRNGLGTSIVTALAEQLAASVSTSSGPAGTSVTITHASTKALEDQDAVM
ncbi:MAG: histidine kinase dimerization/phosphoacceptor domain -containing protein [Alphaproteobacteria bacterium]